MWNARLDEAQAGIKIAGRNISNLWYTNDTIILAESEEELKIFLKKVKEESEKVGLKLNIPKSKVMASSPITSWQIDRETMETVADFILGGPKITAKAFDCVDHNTLWKILKEMGIPDDLTCLLRNLYAGQEATVRAGHRTTGSK